LIQLEPLILDSIRERMITSKSVILIFLFNSNKRWSDVARMRHMEISLGTIQHLTDDFDEQMSDPFVL